MTCPSNNQQKQLSLQIAQIYQPKRIQVKQKIRFKMPIIQMCSYDKYSIIETLGEGTFGKVKLASYDGSYFAIKFATKNNAYSEQVLSNIFEKEASILEQLSHSNIIKLYDVVKSGSYRKQGKEQYRSALVFEYAPYDLSQILQFGPLSQSIARTLFHQMLEALNYLHSKNIIHRDIKPQNILFDHNFNLKICDFGLSAKIVNDRKPKTICGSDSFKSPEMLMKKNYNGVMNDLFAAAVTLFILVSSQPPFMTALPNTGLYKFIALNYVDKFWSTHQKKVKFSPQLKDLLNSMLAFDPTHRLTIPQILAHPWMKGDILMGEDLEIQMTKIHSEIVEKKKKAVLKKLTGRTLKLNKQTNRSLINYVDVAKQITKGKYREQLAKISDRFVPVLNTYEDLEALLQFLEGDLSIKDGVLELSKMIGGQQGKLVLEVTVEQINQKCDCLKFKLKQGDMFVFVETLQKFDEKMLEE